MKLTKEDRHKLEQVARRLEEDSNELARKAQKIRRQLQEDACSGREALKEHP